MNNPTSDTYAAFMQQKGLQPETVTLKHGAQGHWLGNKDAKNVLIYYHGKPSPALCNKIYPHSIYLVQTSCVLYLT